VSYKDIQPSWRVNIALCRVAKANISTYDGSGRTIFLLARAAGVDFDFSIAIR